MRQLLPFSNHRCRRHCTVLPPHCTGGASPTAARSAISSTPITPPPRGWRPPRSIARTAPTSASAHCSSTCYRCVCGESSETCSAAEHRISSSLPIDTSCTVTPGVVEQRLPATGATQELSLNSIRSPSLAERLARPCVAYRETLHPRKCVLHPCELRLVGGACELGEFLVFLGVGMGDDCSAQPLQHTGSQGRLTTPGTHLNFPKTFDASRSSDTCVIATVALLWEISRRLRTRAAYRHLSAGASVRHLEEYN